MGSSNSFDIAKGAIPKSRVVAAYQLVVSAAKRAANADEAVGKVPTTGAGATGMSAPTSNVASIASRILVKELYGARLARMDLCHTVCHVACLTRNGIPHVTDVCTNWFVASRARSTCGWWGGSVTVAQFART